MPWSEVVGRRSRHAKTFADGGRLKSLIHSGTVLHYESEQDSGTFDAEVNMSPVRVNNAVFDGWRVTAAGWHYALGKDIASHGQQDGWVGFGGRKGQHWLKFRLARVGYLHYPTRSWQDVGGAPTYNRANLSQETIPFVHEDGSVQALQARATWANVWSGVDVRWRIEGRGIKEEVVLSETTRNWITANRPPATVPAETYFGFVFQLDVADVPKWIKNGILQNIDGDFDDSDGGIELRTATDALLAFLPVDYAYSESDPTVSIRLRKRIWKDNDGNCYLLVGARVPELAAMPAGGIVFDPSTDITGDTADAVLWSGSSATYADARDTCTNSADTYSNVYVGQRYTGSYNNYRSVLKFDTSSLDGYTVTQVNLKLTVEGLNNNEDFDVVILKYDWSASDPVTSANRETVWDGLLAADLDDNIFRNTSGMADETQYTSGNLNTAWVDTDGTTYYGLISQEDLDNSAPTTTEYIRFHSANSGTAAKRPILAVEYTTSTTHDLTVADAASSVSLDAPSVGYVHTLAVGDVASGASLEAPGLTYFHTLAAQDASSASSLDNVTAGLVHSLIVAGLTSGATLEQVTAGLVHSLSVADAASASAVENAVTTLLHSLVIAGLESGANLDNVAATLLHSLVVSEIASGASLDNVTATLLHTLAVDDLLSAAGIDNISFGTVHNLVVAGLLSGASLDTAAATLIHSLTVADLSSAAALESAAVDLVHSLIVAGLQSATGLDNVSTTLLHTLAVSGLSSASEIDNAAVAMVHSLVVASLQSATSLDDVAVYLFDGIVLLTALSRGFALTAEERSLVLTALRRSLGLTVEERDLTLAAAQRGFDLTVEDR